MQAAAASDNSGAVRIGELKIADGWVHLHIHAFYNASMAG